MSKPKLNHAISVSFSIDTDHEKLESIPIEDLVAALHKRADDILDDAKNGGGGVHEAFEIWDTYDNE